MNCLIVEDEFILDQHAFKKNNELANFEYFKGFGKEDGMPLEQYVKAWLQFHTSNDNEQNAGGHIADSVQNTI